MVIGLVETHGRKETEAQIRDLEMVPQKVIPYRGVNLKEMDVDAIIARHPQTVVVDELAHTNVPGSKNRKRYEDVLELLDAGINVMTAVNIQHLETLNDAVNRSANTTIRETVPDSFFKRADEVVNIDITVDELRTRLRAGQNLRSGKGGAVAGQLFPQGQPEHAARAVAAHHGGAGEQPRVGISAHAGPGTGADSGEGDGVPEHAAGHGAAAARWRAHCRPPGDQLVRGVCDAGPTTRATAIRRRYQRLEEYSAWRATWARRWFQLTDRNVSDALIRFAQQENISHVVFGQPARSRWDILLRGSVLNRFLSEVRDVTVQVVPMQKPLRQAVALEPSSTYSQKTRTLAFSSLASTSTLRSSRWSISSSRFSGLICDSVSGTPCLLRVASNCSWAC